MKMANDDIKSKSGGAQYSLTSIVQTLIVVLGFAAVVSLSSSMDQNRANADDPASEQQLYLSGTTARRVTPGFNALAADWYWLRTLQYVGNKVLAHKGQIQLDDLRALDLRLLYPMLDVATTLDPQFMAPYEYGAVVLPAVDEEKAIKLIEKGMAANPAAWRLNQHLGYIYWKRGDYPRAAATYEAGSRLPGAPQWMKAMSVRMASEGSDPSTAREIYFRLLEETTDPRIKRMASERIVQLDSLDEREAIQKVLDGFRARTNRCIRNWPEVGGDLAAARTRSGARLRINAEAVPLDPLGKPYDVDPARCVVMLDEQSTVAPR